MARHVAFFRNMNLGHRGSPVRAQLEEAFAVAGAEQVRSFQTNGTVLFAAAAPAQALMCVGDELRAACGYDGSWFVRALDRVPALVDAPVWAEPAADVYRETLTFFDADPAGLPELPWSNDAGDVTLLQVLDGCALGLSRQLGVSPGDPNSTIERMLGAQATTRTRGTAERLLRAATPPSA
jgi:hypothetical protein